MASKIWCKFSSLNFIEGKQTCALQVKVHLVNKNTGEKYARSYKSEAFFSFHHANAYERDGCVVVDFCRIDDGGAVIKLTLEETRKGLLNDESEKMRPYITRLVLPLHVPDDAQPGDNLLEKHAFAGKCTAVLETDGAIRLSEERLADIG
jgi:carotenoid cleavage dioxygenase-like enzyme